MSAFIFTPAPVRKASNPRNPYAIIRIAENAAPEIQRAFLRAVAQVRNGTVLTRVREALERGDLRAAYDAIPWEQVGEKTLRDSLPQSLRNVYEQAADSAARKLSRDLELSIRFDVTNPRAVEYIRNHTAALIREFGETNRQTIQHILERSFREGIPPVKAARMIRETGIGLTTRQHIAVENLRRRLENDPSVDLNDAQISARAERYANRLLRQRTETIARTETISASVEGQKEIWREARDEGLIDAKTRREWLAVEDDRVDDVCMDLDGETAPLEGFYPGGFSGPPAHPNCLPGDTRVLARGVMAATKRWFDGDVVVIRTSAGHELTSTPNHPILTDRGWIAAGLLKVGDNVVGASLSEWPTTTDVQHENMPTPIHEVADTLGRCSQMLAVPVPVAPEDFHGDGEGSKVAVVWANRLLVDGVNSSRAQHRSKNDLVLGDIAGSRPKVGIALGAPNQPLSRNGAATDGGVCAGDLSTTSGLIHARPLQEFGSTPAARLNSGLFQSESDAVSGEAILIGESLDGPSLRVERHQFGNVDQPPGSGMGLAVSTADRDATPSENDKDAAPMDADLARDLLSGSACSVLLTDVVATFRRQFSGHVYNLETVGKWYIANGIITHNCRCAERLVFEE